MIRQAKRQRLIRLFGLLWCIVFAIYFGAEADGWGHLTTLWFVLLATMWAHMLVTIHRALRAVQASPFHYLLLVQDEFGR